MWYFVRKLGEAEKYVRAVQYMYISRWSDRIRDALSITTDCLQW